MNRKNRITIKYKEREWLKVPIGQVRTINSILEEFAPLMLIPERNIDVFVNSKKSRRGAAIKDGDILEIKDEEDEKILRS